MVEKLEPRDPKLDIYEQRFGIYWEKYVDISCDKLSEAKVELVKDLALSNLGLGKSLTEDRFDGLSKLERVRLEKRASTIAKHVIWPQGIESTKLSVVKRDMLGIRIQNPNSIKGGDLTTLDYQTGRSFQSALIEK